VEQIVGASQFFWGNKILVITDKEAINWDKSKMRASNFYSCASGNHSGKVSSFYHHHEEEWKFQLGEHLVHRISVLSRSAMRKRPFFLVLLIRTGLSLADKYAIKRDINKLCQRCST
jgi:hypothetical protein